jgi:hypothetical protein
LFSTMCCSSVRDAETKEKSKPAPNQVIHY